MAASTTPAAETDPVVAPVVLHRNRLAIALVATIAAVPLLVLDNLPATANTSQPDTAQVATVFVPDPTIPAVDTTVPPTTAAPSTTEATTPTTAAPPTTVARVVAAKKATPVTSAPTTTTTAPPPPPSYAYGDPDDPATWDRMAQCEANGDWAANTGNGYYGGLQFSLSTWQQYGGTGYPHQAPKATQIQIGKRLQADRGWDAWPSCSRQLGYT